MSNISRRNFLRAFGASAVLAGLAGCGSTGNTESIAVCLASEPDVIDPALNSAVDGATMLVHLFAGLAKWEKQGETFVIVPDCASELPEPVDNGDGTYTYTYTLRDGLKWSDGQDLTAKDFEFSMKRAAGSELGADYGYLYEIVDGYEDDDINVVAADDKTLQITTTIVVPYWNELLAFPTFFPVREDVVADEAWCTDPSTYISNGAYTMTGWDHNSVITVEKNENYYDANNIKMKKIEFYLSDDANNMLANFQNGSWQLIDDVPTNEISSLKEQYPEEFHIEGQIGTYYVSWNINKDILPSSSKLKGTEKEEAAAEIRNAITLLFDRNYIVNDVAQGGQLPASSFVSKGLTEPDGSDFSENAGDPEANGYPGYYAVDADSLQSNFDSCVETLKKYYDYDEASGKFTDFPTIDYLYNTSEGHKAIGEYLASALDQIGITMNLENQEWNTFLNTRKAGDFTVARNGWVCDYNDPISMLDMWISDSGNNDCQFGKGDHESVKAYSVDLTDLGYDLKVEGGTWAETFDEIIATVKSESDNTKRMALMHRAEDLLMSTGCICPIYFYTDLYMIDSAVDGFFSIPLGYKFFHYTSIK